MKHTFLSAIQYLACALAFLSIIPNVSAQSHHSGKQLYNTTEEGLAIKGYDPVAYFTDNTAQEGKQDIRYVYDGVTYRFTNQQHLNSFKMDPQKYMPQYGGWCAYAMGATGEKVDVDPETFKLLNGRLYLFYNRFFNNTKKSWDKDEINLKQKADVNWQMISR